jgi:integrase
MLLRDAAAAYMHAEPTRDHARAQRLSWWVEKLGDVPLAELDSDVIGDLLEAYAQEPVRKFYRKGADGSVYREFGTRSNATVNRLRAVLGGFLSWCRKRRLTPKGWQSPVRDTEARKESGGRTRFLTEREETALLACAKVSTLPRLYLLCLFAIHSGARLGELLGLKGRSLEFRRDKESGQEYGLAHLPLTKNGDPAALVMTPEVVAEIRRVAPKIAADDWLFPSPKKPGQPMTPKRAFERAVEDAGLAGTGIVFHTLRHQHASRCAAAGLSLQRIAMSMRHKSLAMAQRYAHLAAEEKIASTVAIFSKAIADEQGRRRELEKELTRLVSNGAGK